MQSHPVLPPTGLVLKAQLVPRLLDQGQCVAACRLPQRRIMSHLVPTTLNHHSSLHRRLMHNRNCRRSSSNSSPRYRRSPTGSRTLTMAPMLAVSHPHLLLHLQVLGAHQLQLRPRPQPHCLLMLFVPPAPRQKSDQSSRTEQHLHATDTRDHINIMLTRLLLVVSPVAHLRQHLLKQQRSKQLVIVRSAHQPRRQSDTANGKIMSISPSLRATRKSDKRWKSLTAAVPPPLIACRRRKCRVTVRKMDPTLDGSTMATTPLRLLIIRHRFRQ